MDGDTTIYEACGTAAYRMTVNQIELEAVTQGLAFLMRYDPPNLTQVWTDSQYTSSTIGNLLTLKEQMFLTADGWPIANAEQIKLLYDFLFEMDMHSKVIIRKTKGHKGILGNERADQLSKRAAYKGESWARFKTQ